MVMSVFVGQMTPITEMRCHCGLRVAKRTSWTLENPGRKFLACKFYNHETGQRGCDKFEWIDEECLDWQRDITNVLLAEKHRLATDLNILKARLCLFENEKKRVKAELEKMKKKNLKNADYGKLNKGMIPTEQHGVKLLICCCVVSVVVSLCFVNVLG
ncbi:uncharacterized protein LOC104901620 [Beta vulgaris subsp. vulgaris]|uniref:uncharacterized protein LOC104901620 n=1 Tax=Beta vulgaris subsp. vulgaris TaxID=3555 RepID=UPI00053FF646|nr:uncharacterized protein LOC104901620 [Beta vulgaris subsp. vulgaris]